MLPDAPEAVVYRTNRPSRSRARRSRDISAHRQETDADGIIPAVPAPNRTSGNTPANRNGTPHRRRAVPVSQQARKVAINRILKRKSKKLPRKPSQMK